MRVKKHNRKIVQQIVGILERKRDERLFSAEPELKLTPDVRLYGEFVVSQTFRCSPLNGELGSSVSCVRVPSH